MSDFPNTCWTLLVNRAALWDEQQPDPAVTEALNELCQTYWYPIYAYARTTGKLHHQAQDLTQSFFEQLVQSRWVAKADRTKTKFRTFLLTHFKYVISNEYRKASAEKRGGAIEHLAFDFEGADERFQALAAEGTDPSLAYDRAWASQVIEQTLVALRKENDRNPSPLPFDALLAFLPGGAARGSASYQDLEKQYGLSVDAIKQRVSRLNKRFREVLVAIVANTVTDPAQVDEEIKSLVVALAS
jgi:RNA polymerase sigma factor (sigma-70 family)